MHMLFLCACKDNASWSCLLDANPKLKYKNAMQTYKQICHREIYAEHTHTPERKLNVSAARNINLFHNSLIIWPCFLSTPPKQPIRKWVKGQRFTTKSLGQSTELEGKCTEKRTLLWPQIEVRNVWPQFCVVRPSLPVHDIIVSTESVCKKTWVPRQTRGSATVTKWSSQVSSN
jgi:hypothetical protein